METPHRVMELLVQHQQPDGIQDRSQRSFSPITATLVFLLSTLVCKVLVEVWLKHRDKRLTRSRLLKRMGIDSVKEAPGPRGLPILGYLPFLGKQAHVKLNKLAQKFGSIYQIAMGPYNAIVLSDPELIRKCFREEVFSARPEMFMRQDVLKDQGLILVDGPKWREHRSFASQILRTIGLSKFGGVGANMLHEHVRREVADFTRYIDEQKGQPVDLRHILTCNVANIISSIVCGQRFEYGDPRFRRCVRIIEEGFELMEISMLVNFFPSLRKLPYVSSAYNKIVGNHEQSIDFFQQIIDEHRVTIREGETRDFIDAYLHQLNSKEVEHTTNEDVQEETEISNDTKTPRAKPASTTSFSESQMLQSVIDLFSAGMETTKASLLWSFLYIATHREQQKRVQEELDRVLESGCLPTVDDLKHLPYVDATLNEVQRLASVVPMGTPHAVAQDVVWNGYYLAKDSWIVPNIWGLHRDPKLWKNPTDFMPERFLNAAGECVRPDYYMPFGVGRRRCIGESIARAEIFIVFASVLQNFDLSLPANAPAANFDGVVGISLNPQPFELCLRRRKRVPRPA